MLDFYRLERADKGTLEDESDMLLFQWGTYDWGNGNAFDLNITRQFEFVIVHSDDGDDERMWQLGHTFRFAPWKLQGSSNRWCNSVEELTDFRAFIHNSEPFIILGEEMPVSVSLNYEQV